MSKRMVFMAKIVDDKELGMYIEDIYFGGIAHSLEEEESIKQCCIANKSSYYRAKTVYVDVGERLSNVIDRVKRIFEICEKNMIECEDMIKNNTMRSKRRSK